MYCMYILKCHLHFRMTMWPQTNFEKRVFIKMVSKLRRTKSEKDKRKEYILTIYIREATFVDICRLAIMSSSS